MATDDEVEPTDARILADLYGLNWEQVRVYNKLEALVDEALIQFDKGYAVDVERHMADLAKEWKP